MTANNGDFYINNVNDDFYLREANVWHYKGRLVKANIVGLYAEGPFVGLDQFELARSVNPVAYSQAFSSQFSEVSAEFPPAADVDIVFTDDLAAYLAYGDRAICTAHIAANTHVATLTFLDATVEANSPVWAVLPASADVAFAGLRMLIGGGLV